MILAVSYFQARLLLFYKLTMIAVSGQILLVNVQIVILVEFPKFAVNNIEVLVAEVRGYLVDILLLFQELNNAE